jgi:hypothetical protein
LPAVRTSLTRHLLDALRLVGDFAEPFRHGARVERIRGMGDLPNFFRKPCGDGWALVGDAGYHKDPILAQGISDAFRSSEWWPMHYMRDFLAPERWARRWPNTSAFVMKPLRRCMI